MDNCHRHDNIGRVHDRFCHRAPDRWLARLDLPGMFT